MNKTIKLITGLTMSLVVIGAVTLLVIKYFDVLAKVFDSIKDQISSKKPSFLGDACCDFGDDEDMELGGDEV